MTAAAAVPTAMETRMDDTWNTRETDTPAGERTAAATAAVAAGTAEEEAAAMTAGATPSSGQALQDYTRMPRIFFCCCIFF